MVSRVYAEKKPGFDIEAHELSHELRHTLGIKSLKNVLRAPQIHPLA